MNLVVDTAKIRAKMEHYNCGVAHLSRATGLTKDGIRHVLKTGTCRWKTAETIAHALNMKTKDIILYLETQKRSNRSSSVEVDRVGLTKLILDADLNVPALADKAQLSKNTVYLMMQGKSVRRDTLSMLAEALGVPAERLIIKEKGVAKNGSRKNT